MDLIVDRLIASARMMPRKFMKLGLANNSVKLVAYTEDWIAAFIEQKSKIETALSGFRPVVEHVGSTSIPGLASKPIIDIAVGITDYGQVGKVIELLEQIGYSSRGFYSPGLGTVLELLNEGVRTHCIHLLNMSDTKWDDCIYFRNALRNDETKRNNYQSLKENLANKYANERRRYTQEKNVFVDAILQARPR